MSKISRCAVALALAACAPATSAPPAPPTIESFAVPIGKAGERQDLQLDDHGRPVLIDYWLPPAGLAPRGLVLISHGSQSKGRLHTYMGEHLSSRGYLVLAPNHYGDTLGTPATDAVYPNRVADMKVALDQGEARAEWRPYFDAGVAAAGHSIGGFDALALCGAAVDEAAVNGECADGNQAYCRLGAEKERWTTYTDARVKTCIGLTPFVHPIYGAKGEGAAGIDRPLFLIGAVLDPILLLDPYLRDFNAHVEQPDSRMIELEGVGHLDFTDLMHDGTLDHEVMKTIVNAYVTAWLEAQLHADVQAAALFTEEAIESSVYGYTVNSGKR